MANEVKNVHPCNVCGKDAVACLSPDMDIKGLCFCEAHREDVYMVYMTMIDTNIDGTIIAKGMMKNWKYK